MRERQRDLERLAPDFAALIRATALQLVGWVERSETHRGFTFQRGKKTMGFAFRSTHPTALSETPLPAFVIICQSIEYRENKGLTFEIVGINFASVVVDFFVGLGNARELF
jgi:hypothetical protein